MSFTVSAFCNLYPFCFHEILGQRIHSLFKIAGSNRNNVSVCLGFLLRILLAKLDHLINFNGRIVLEKVEAAAINHDVPQ